MILIVGDTVRFTDWADEFGDELTITDILPVGAGVFSYTLYDHTNPNAEIRSYGSELTFVRAAQMFTIPKNSDQLSFFDGPVVASNADRVGVLRSAITEVLKMHVDDRCSECGKGKPCPTRVLLTRGMESAT